MTVNFTREGYINIQNLFYACACLFDGDIEAVRRVGLSPKTIEKILNMPVRSLLRVACTQANGVFDNQFCQSKFERLLNAVSHEETQQRLCEALLRRDAPMSLMQSLFALSSGEYKLRRKLFGIESGVGRLRKLEESEEAIIWDAFENQGRPIVEKIGAQQWIDLSDMTGLSVRHLYASFQEFKRLDDKKVVRKKAAGSLSLGYQS